MADKKISELTSGAPAVATDAVPVARSGVTRKLTLADIWTIPSGSQLLNADGTVAAPGIAFGSNAAIGIRKTGNALQFCRGSAVHFSLDQTYGDDITLQSGGSVSFTASADASVAPDTGIARLSAGILKVVAGNPASTLGRLNLNSGTAVSPSISLDSTHQRGWYYAGGVASGAWIWAANPTSAATVGPNGYSVNSTGLYAWSSGNVAAAINDTALARSAAAVVKVTDGSTNLGRILTGGGSVTSPALGISNADGTSAQNGFYSTGTNAVGFTRNGALLFTIGHALGTEISLNSAMPLNWASGAATASADVGIIRNAAGVLKVTNGSSGSGTIVSNGTTGTSGFAVSVTGAQYGGMRSDGAGGILFQNDSGFATAKVLLTLTTTNGLQVGSTDVMGFSSAGAGAAGNDLTLSRATAGVLRVAGASGAGLGVILAGSWVQNNTGGTVNLNQANPAELLVNNGAGSTVTANLPNDPTIGTYYDFAVMAAQSMDIVPASGESIRDGASTGTTKITSNTIGSTLRLCAVTNGSGAVWLVMWKTGTWTVS